MSNTPLPPQHRTALWRGVTEAAGRDEFCLQVCADCQSLQYPPREICRQCLGDELVWQAVDPAGTVQSWTRLHASGNDFFRDHLPWLTGSIKLQCGPVVFAHLTADCAKTGTGVRIVNRLDRSGQAVLIAIPENAELPITDKNICALLKE